GSRAGAFGAGATDRPGHGDGQCGGSGVAPPRPRGVRLVRPGAVMSQGELSDRVSLITGASRGIGRAIALELARRGSSLVLASRSMEDLQPLARECETEGVRSRAVRIDLADAASISAGCEQALKEFGRIDCLVNNA